MAKTTRSTASDTPVEQSPKKAAADHVNMAAPQVLEVGDSLFGLRAGSFGDAPDFGLNFEHLVRPNFGVGLQVDRATYSNKYNYNGYGGKYDYTDYAAMVYGTFHFDLFKIRNLDTYAGVGLGYGFLSHKWKDSSGNGDPGDADKDAAFVTAFVGARYFIDSHWAVMAEVGGVSGAAIGVDYLF